MEKTTATPLRFTRAVRTITLATGLLLTACQTSSPDQLPVDLSGLWSGTQVEDVPTGPTFRLDVNQTDRRLEGELEVRVDFPHGSGHEMIGRFQGDVQGDIVTLRIQGVNEYAGKIASFSGRVIEGRLEGGLASQLGERLKSGRVVMVRR